MRTTIQWAAAMGLALSALTTAEPCRAASVTIGAEKDATIFEDPPGAASSGMGNGLFAGNNGNSFARRGLIKFNLMGVLPPGAVVTGVELKLTLGQVAGSGGNPPPGTIPNENIELRPLAGDWGEGQTQKQNPPSDSLSGQGSGAAAQPGDATWASQFHATDPWDAPGGDFGGVSATTPVGAAGLVDYHWNSAAMLADVLGWLVNPSANFGWLIRNANEDSPTNFRAFYSKDTLTASRRPALTITYVPEPESAASLSAALLAASCVWRGRPRIGKVKL